MAKQNKKTNNFAFYVALIALTVFAVVGVKSLVEAGEAVSYAIAGIATLALVETVVTRR